MLEPLITLLIAGPEGVASAVDVVGLGRHLLRNPGESSSQLGPLVTLLTLGADPVATNKANPSWAFPSILVGRVSSRTCENRLLSRQYVSRRFETCPDVTQSFSTRNDEVRARTCKVFV